MILKGDNYRCFWALLWSVDSWQHIATRMRRGEVFNIFLLVLALALTTIGIAARRRSQRNLVFVSILPIYGYLIFFTSNDNVVANCILGSVISTFFFTSFNFLVSTDPQAQFHQVNEPLNSIQEKPFLNRFLWASDLLGSPRGLGWAHEPKNSIRPKPRTTTRAFFATQLIWLVVYTLLCEIAEKFHQRNPCFFDDGPPLSSYGWLWRMLSVTFIAVSVVGMFNIMHLASSIISVATGMSKVEDWPPLFGSWFDAYTVRRFWGYVKLVLLCLIRRRSQNIVQKNMAPNVAHSTWFTFPVIQGPILIIS